jgi:hypothetical protein
MVDFEMWWIKNEAWCNGQPMDGLTINGTARQWTPRQWDGSAMDGWTTCDGTGLAMDGSAMDWTARQIGVAMDLEMDGSDRCFQS